MAGPVRPTPPGFQQEGAGARPLTVARAEIASQQWPLLLHVALLLVAAFAIRQIQLGNPVIQVDDQFYLLVGDRMLHGALPFVDIWDRKPVGLFLLYAGIRLLGGDGILQYQIAATLFAAATAIMIARIGQRIGNGFAALCAGIVYLMWIEWFGGDGGQTPVFYNALMVGAALAVLAAIRPDVAPARLRRLGCGAMLLVGLSLQIKYSCVFEGVFFGLVLLHCSWRTGDRPGRIVLNAALWIGCALAPTLLAFAFYLAIGHGSEFAYANFLSIFERIEEPVWELNYRLSKIVRNSLILTAPAVLAVWLARQPAPGSEAARTRAFVWGWFAAAWAALLLMGSYYDHYFLPVIVPIALAVVPALSLRLVGPVLAISILAYGDIAYHRILTRNIEARGGQAEVTRLVSLIRPNLHSGCLFVFDGEPILYYATNACIPTRYAFPGHLDSIKELAAIGADGEAELRRVLASNPPVIVVTRPHDRLRAASRYAIVDPVLASRYRLVGAVRVGRLMRTVYALNTLPVTAPPSAH
jgi:hypothetical protein